MLDKSTSKIFLNNINMTVPWYLMASYAYYKEDNPIWSDGFFDRTAKLMVRRWADIEHFHKHLINKDYLNAGSYLGEYPSRVIGGLESVRQEYFTKAGSVKAKYLK